MVGILKGIIFTMHRHVEGTVRTTRGAGGVQQACNDEHNNGKHNGETERENRTDVGGGGHIDGGQAASYSRLLWTHPQSGQPDALPRPGFADASW